MFQRDTCGKNCAYKRNLVRHVKEVHFSITVEYWNSPVLRCASKYLGRSSRFFIMDRIILENRYFGPLEIILRILESEIILII